MEPQEQQPIRKMHPHFLEFFAYYLFGTVLVIAGIVLFAFMFVVGVIILLVGVLVLIVGETSRRAETFLIWDNGVEREYKMLSSSHKFVEYHNIQNMEVRQSFFQNIFRIGNMKFNTAGPDKTEVLFFHGVKNPKDVERIIQERMKSV